MSKRIDQARQRANAASKQLLQATPEAGQRDALNKSLRAKADLLRAMQAEDDRVAIIASLQRDPEQRAAVIEATRGEIASFQKELARAEAYVSELRGRSLSADDPIVVAAQDQVTSYKEQIGEKQQLLDGLTQDRG